MIIFSGKIFYQNKSLYAAFIFPIVQIRDLFKWVYHFILTIIWSELIDDQKINNESINFLLLLAFILISLVAYYLANYIQIILIGFSAIWIFDYWIARSQSSFNHTIVVELDELQDDLMIWKMSLPDGKIIKSGFLSSQIKNISLVQRPVYGGAFQELMGTVWQIEIILYNGSDLLMDEQQQVIDAFNQAKYLAAYFKVPMIFSGSQGNGNYAAQPIKPEIFNNNGTIQCRKSQCKWHIYSKWQLKNSYGLLKQILRESGFLLFVLIMANFVSKFGQLVNAFIAPYLGINSETIYMTNIFAWLIPNWNWKTEIELAIAIVFMIFKGWQMSRVKHIYIDKYYLNFFIDNQKIDRVNTKDIEAILFLQKDNSEILILAKDKTISIQKFQQEEDLAAFLIQVDAGIKQFQMGNW